MGKFDWDAFLRVTTPCLETELLYPAITGRTLLITGGGGSIGRALAKQLLAFNPRQLILLDQSEYGLHLFEKSIRHLELGLTNVRFLLGDAASSKFVSKIFEKERPEIVFHTAAYKHVHFAESNSQEVVRNNLGTTHSVVSAAINSGVETFIHISSDKAVDPIGVMGKTKRISELLVSAIRSSGLSKFYSVRFGNILGSSGSFTENLPFDIKKNHKIPITDERMSRYFTTRRHVTASLLASLMETNPLDVLVPRCHVEKNIVDLINEVARFVMGSGYTVNFETIGIRPGEKLSECLIAEDEILASESSWFSSLNIPASLSSKWLLDEISHLLLEEFRSLERVSLILDRHYPSPQNGVNQ